MHEMDRHELDRAEPAVDPTDQLVHRPPQALVLFHVLPGRHGHLDEHDFADPFGVLFQEDFERVQFLRHAFDVVEAIDADDDFDVLEAGLELFDAVDDSGFG